MSASTKLAGYAVVLAAVFGGALAVGAIAGPIDTSGDAGHVAPVELTSGAEVLPGGLSVAQAGYRLVLDSTTLQPNVPTDFGFQVVDPVGRPLAAYDELHERSLHLVVVSRNLVDYFHLHPQMRPDGHWTIALPGLPPGSYRLFADFQPSGSSNLTLGADLAVPGELNAGELPPASAQSVVDGYNVALNADPVVGETELSFTVRRDGETVRTDPYLGASGHLVAIRSADLAYLHVHPQENSSPEIRFTAELPSGGTYRLFLDFSHDGEVHTATFTLAAADSTAAPQTGSSPHDEGH